MKPYCGRSKIINVLEVRNDFLYNAKHEKIEETKSEQQSEQESTESIAESVKKGGEEIYLIQKESGESAEHRRNKTDKD